MTWGWWSRLQQEMSTNMEQLKRIIEAVLQESFADLEEMFSNEDMLKKFSSRLYQKKIVTKTTKDKPTFNLVVKDFNNYMIFMKIENEFREHCISFITSLQSLEGPALKAAEILKSEWNKAMKEKYNPKAQETNSAGVSSLVSPNPSTVSSVLRQNLQRCPFLNKIHTDIGDNLSNGLNAGKSLNSMWLDEAQRNSKSTDEDIPYANEPQSESGEKSSTATVWLTNKGSHHTDSATQHPKTEQVIPHKDNEEQQIRHHYTDPSYYMPPNKNDQRVPQEHESPDQLEPPQHPNVPHDTQHSPIDIASSGKDDSPDKSERPTAATLSLTNDSRNPFQATDVSETHEELLVPNGGTIPRSHSYNKLKTHLQVQTSIKEVQRNKTSDVNCYEEFMKHYPQLPQMINFPSKLANSLMATEFISQEQIDAIFRITDPISCSSRLLQEVRNMLYIHKDHPQIQREWMEKFCDVLRKQNTPTLFQLAKLLMPDE